MREFWRYDLLRLVERLSSRTIAANLRDGCPSSAPSCFIKPQPNNTILQPILAILVVLLSADDIGQVIRLDGKKNVGVNAL